MFSRLSLLSVLESNFAGLQEGNERLFLQTDSTPGSDVCLGHCTCLTGLWTLGGRIGLRGESTVKRCGKVVLLVDLDCVSSSCPAQLLIGSKKRFSMSSRRSMWFFL